MLFLLLSPTFLVGQNPQLTQELNVYLAKHPTMNFSLSVQTMKGKMLFEHNSDALMPAASIIKIPILIEFMEEVKAGKFKLTDKHTLLASEKVEGGALFDYPNDTILMLRDLAKQMIVSSDNSATNILIRKMGMAAVNQRLEKLGIKKTRLNRVMLDTEAVKQGRENYVNTLEINNLLRSIYKNKVATKALCREMMAFLFGCTDRSTIPNLIPPSVKIAHKTGELNYVRGDAAIIFTPKPFVVSVFIKNFNNLKEAEQTIAEIGEICWKNLK